MSRENYHVARVTCGGTRVWSVVWSITHQAPSHPPRPLVPKAARLLNTAGRRVFLGRKPGACRGGRDGRADEKQTEYGLYARDRNRQRPLRGLKLGNRTGENRKPKTDCFFERATETCRNAYSFGKLHARGRLKAAGTEQCVVPRARQGGAFSLHAHLFRHTRP